MTTRARAVAVDLALTTALATAMFVEAIISTKVDGGLSPVGAFAIVAAAAPVMLRRRAPGVAFAACLLLLFPLFAAVDIYQTIPFPSVVTAYALALRGSRVQVLAAWVAASATVVATISIHSDHGLLHFETVKNLVIVVVPLLAGLAVSNYRAYLCSLEERAAMADQKREEETMRRIGEERLRIARDLHDVVTHSMVAINVQAGVAAHLLDRDTEQARASLLDIKRVSGEALSDLRSALEVVRGDDLDAPVAPTARLPRIDELATGLRAAGIHVDTSVEPGVELLPPEVDEAAFRIVQEALTNVLRHARPRRTTVTVRAVDDTVEVDVHDDGRGSVASPHGNGITGMHARAAALGGSVTAGPADDGGWHVAARIPVGAP
ncbi:sensor histidine kinase [Aeromicrobium sp. Leaf350]|uniref:sensor histidine kinase n=1 Tax=Aeromicrobium sp. Leaf350 TaxID=2876565 RepID=UPI001E529012|nr:sensor histidine kinase [Aeromicrobium sp. Leaf350]